MQIDSGLFDHMVLQRTARDVCDVSIVGRCSLKGTVTALVRKGRQPLRKFRNAAIGKAERKRFKARLKGLPAGGPYDVELRISTREGGPEETLIVKNVLVGDVWILAGQSNMEGCGNRKHAARTHRLVRAFFMDDRWDVARDPIHNLWNAVDPVHGGSPDGKDDGGKGVGPGVAFGKAMHRLTGAPQGLIACAHGGTSMEQWDPALRKAGGKSLYGAMLRRFRRNGGKVAGVAWYQGESDAGKETAPFYTARMKTLVRSMRRDMGDPKLPFVAAQLCWYAGNTWDPQYWNSIQDQQRRLPDVLPRCATVPAVDLRLDDIIHVGGASQNVLGARLAEAMHSLRGGRRAATPPIALKRVGIDTANAHGIAHIVAEFDNVVGELRAGERPMGFSVCGDQGPEACIFDVVLQKNRAVLRTIQPELFFVDKRLHYGYGLNPPCNVTDGEGRPLPVFGPVPIMKPRLATPFVRTLRVSRLLPGEGRLRATRYPDNRRPLRLAPHTSEYEFVSVHEQLAAAQGDTLVFFACRIRCPEPMRLALLLGYDGPVKAWIDGKERLHDPNGTNPAKPDNVSIPFRGGKGQHEIVVALGSNRGNAWGIYLRFERLGISSGAIERGRGRYALPTVLG